MWYASTAASGNRSSTSWPRWRAFSSSRALNRYSCLVKSYRAAPLQMTPGAFMGTSGAYFSKAARARPVEMANRPPSAMKYVSACRFRSGRGGMGSPRSMASSV